MGIDAPIVADLAGLCAADAVLGRAALDAELHAIEDARRVLAGREARALALAEEYRLYAQDAHATMWGYLRADLGWSRGECTRRMRLARLVAAHPQVGERLSGGEVPVAAVDEIARAHANPRCGDQLGAVLPELLHAATIVEHDAIHTLVERWLTLADPDGAHRDSEATHARRNAHVDVFAGQGTITAQLGALDGADAVEIFEHFVDAEFHTDWDAATAQYGDLTCKALLARTDAQRRADAIMTIFRTAATAPINGPGRAPVVNLVVDAQTFADHLIRLELLPGDFTADWAAVRLAERRCETTTGIAVTPHEVFQAALAGLIRTVIVNRHGQPIQASTTQRLFRGAARDTVMSQGPHCTHRGCRIRTGRSHADHTHPHAHNGPTTLDNGGIACPRHNTTRYQHHYTTRRDKHGWHTYRPDGTEIGFQPPEHPS